MDIEAELRGAKLSWFHIRLALVLGCVLFVDGYDLFNGGYIAPYIRDEWGLSDRQIGVMLSMGIAGLAIGAYLQAPLARRVGRRAAIAVGCIVLALASLTMATIVNDFASFLVLRLILGISLGMLSPLVFVYVNEWAPGHSANLFATISFVLPFSLGGIAAGVAAMTLGPLYGWRALYLVAGIGLPIALLGYLFLPESLVRLLKQGRIDQIRSYLVAIRPDRRAIYEAARHFTLPEPSHGATGLAPLFSANYRVRTICIWLASALSLVCLHGISGWLPSLLVAQGTAFSSAFGYGTLLMTMQIVGGGVAGGLADRYGRARVMTWGFVGSAIVMIGMVFALGNGWMALMVAGAGFTIFGTQAIMNSTLR